MSRYLAIAYAIKNAQIIAKVGAKALIPVVAMPNKGATKPVQIDKIEKISEPKKTY
jgi:hypothetical protein